MQSVAIRMSISSVMELLIFSRSLEIGEKLVKILFKSVAPIPLMVVLFSSEPVTKALCKL
ncbi:hypothetical protein DSECCO2_648980 [anaerobic digester metagenome]